MRFPLDSCARSEETGLPAVVWTPVRAVSKLGNVRRDLGAIGCRSAAGDGSSTSQEAVRLRGGGLGSQPKGLQLKIGTPQEVHGRPPVGE